MKVLEKTYWELHGEEILVAHRLKKAEFAQKLNISAQNVNKWLATKDLGNLSRIATALDVDLDYLLYGPREEGQNVCGYLEYNGTIHKISSVEDVKTFLEKLEKK